MEARHLLLLPILISFSSLLGTASASSGGNMTINQTLLNFSAQYAQCKTVFTTSFLGDLESASPQFSSYSEYSTNLLKYNSHLSQLALNGNVSEYESYQSGTYDKELNLIASNVSLGFRSANLSANTISRLRQQYNSSWTAYTNCTSARIKAYAEEKLLMFERSINAYQNESASLSGLGIDTANLTALLNKAQTEIVTPFSTAISSATNNSQIEQALQEYCLFDGCGSGTNFHLAAHFSLEKLQLVLGYLESDKNISASSLAGAQAHLNNASSILVTVGSKAYAGSQEKNIFANLSAASQEMAQAKKQDSFYRVKSDAERVLAGYETLLNADKALVARLAAQGMNTTQLNLTLSDAQTTVIEPLSSGLNSSTNASQIVSLFNSYCLDNSCSSGTNFHLAVKLKLGEDSAYLAWQEARANATALVIVNQSALSAAESDLSSVSSLLSTVGAAQLNSSQEAQIDSYFNMYKASVREAFRANLSAVSAVDAINATVIKSHMKHSKSTTTTVVTTSNRVTTSNHTTAVTSVAAHAGVNGTSGSPSGSGSSINTSVNGSADANIKTHGK